MCVREFRPGGDNFSIEFIGTSSAAVIQVEVRGERHGRVATVSCEVPADTVSPVLEFSLGSDTAFTDDLRLHPLAIGLAYHRETETVQYINGGSYAATSELALAMGTAIDVLESCENN